MESSCLGEAMDDLVLLEAPFELQLLRDAIKVEDI